jgi:hypothetical protein
MTNKKGEMECLDAFLTHHYNLHIIKQNKQVQCENDLQFWWILLFCTWIKKTKQV